MKYISKLGVAGLLAPFIGLVLLLIAIYARRHHKLHGRVGAAIVAGVAGVLALLAMMVGIWPLL